ncbi:MAG: V-type ATP synthase subunit C [Methanosarcinaceae archaeon]
MRLLQKIRRKSRSAQNRGSSNYAYATARVRAMKSNLLPIDTYPRLMNMGINEITRFIQETQYKQEVDELAREYTGVDLIEYALSTNLAHTFSKIIRFTEGELCYLVTEYLRNYDIWNIKTLLRGKYYNAPVGEIKESIVSAGQLNYSFLAGLADMDSYTDVIEGLKNTPYYTVLKEFDGTNLSEIENMLDQMYYSGLFHAIGGLGVSDRRLLSTFIRSEIDIKNIRTLFRLKKYTIEDEEEIPQLILAGGLELKMDDIEKMIPLSTEEFGQVLEKYSYWKAISNVVGSDMDSLIALETELTKYSIRSATKFSHAHPLSIAPIMDYIVSKRNEVSNLRIIIRGKASNLNEEVIRNQLVI